MSLKECTHQNWGTAEQAHVLWRPNTRDPNTEAKHTRASAWLRSGCSLKWKLEPFGSFSFRRKKLSCEKSNAACLYLINAVLDLFMHLILEWIIRNQKASTCNIESHLQTWSFASSSWTNYKHLTSGQREWEQDGRPGSGLKLEAAPAPAAVGDRESYVILIL